jgi:hypothetical protein
VYEITDAPESDEDEIFVLNSVQSAESKQPKTALLAVSQSASFAVRVRPSPKVMGTS